MSKRSGIGGLRQFQANCARLAREADGLCSPALGAVAATLVAHAKDRAPVDEGDLRGGVGMVPLPGGGYAVGVFGPAEEYAGYVEFGTGEQAPQPFMTPALVQTYVEAPQIAGPVVDARVQAAVKAYKA